MEDLLKIIGIFITIFIVILFIFENKGRLKADIRRVAVVFLIFVIIIIVASINLSRNGRCSIESKSTRPFSDIPQIQCRIDCYCDGFKVDGQCLGKWRKVCSNG